MKNQGNLIEEKPSYGKLLRLPTFRSLWFGQIASQLAINTLLFVLALRIYQTTGSNTAVSGLFLAFGIPAVFFGMVAGAIVDRLNKRTVLLLCDLARAVLVFGLVFFSHSLWFVYILMFVNAVITQFYVPSEAPTIPLIVPKEMIVSANSLFSFTFYSSLALGSILAGPLLRLFGPYGIFVFISGLFILAALNVFRLQLVEEGTQRLQVVFSYRPADLIRKIWRNLTDGVAYVSKSPVLLDALILLTGTQIILALLGTLGPGFADKMLNIDVRDSSIYIVGPAVVGILLGALWVGTYGTRYAAKKLINTGVVGAGVMLLLISLVVWLKSFQSFQWLFNQQIVMPLMLVLFFLLGAANSLLDVPANSMIQEEANGMMRGRVYGILAAAVGGVGVLPVIVGGVLADTVGVGKVVFLLGACITLYGVTRGRYNKGVTRI